MRLLSSFVCIAGLLATLATAQAAEDADKTASKSLIRQGNALLDKGKFQQALDKFEQAYQRFQSPKIFFNQAQALHGLDRSLDALLAYRRFLSEAKDAGPEIQAEAQQQIAGLTGKVGRIDVRSNQQGAIVRIDGKEQGPTPLTEPVYVEPGNHTVTLEWQSEQKSASVAAAPGAVASTEAIFDSRPVPVEQASNREGAVVRVDEKESGAPSLAPTFEDKPAVAIVQPTPPAPEPRPWYRSRWVWVAGGVAVAAVATTLVLVSSSHDRYPANTMGTQPVGN